MDLVIVYLGVFAILLQFMAAYVAYGIYRFNRLSSGWLLVVAAFLLQGVRRMVTLAYDLGYQKYYGEYVFFDRFSMFMISLMMVVGLYSMLRNFQSFEVVSKRVVEKLQDFKK